MSDITANVVFSFKVTPDPALDQPHQTTEALDRAAKSVNVNLKTGVTLVLVTVGTSAPVPS